MRYILALLADFPDLLIKEAQRLFAPIADGYLLSSNSLPHITIVQFNLDANEQLLQVWQGVQSAINTAMQPHFIGIMLSKKNINGTCLWGASLAVARTAELVKLHATALSVLKQFDIRCINESGELYRPHLTLARIKEPTIVDFNDKVLEDTQFTIALGQGDIHGQFLKTIYKFSFS